MHLLMSFVLTLTYISFVHKKCDTRENVELFFSVRKSSNNCRVCTYVAGEKWHDILT